MGMMLSLRGWLAAPRLARQIDAAEALADRLRDAGPLVLAPRSRAAHDRLIDALNRLPRPVAVLGSLTLITAGLVAPEWFAARMETLALMPEGLWWLIGAVLSLHFGARIQSKAQAFEREIVEAVATAAPSAPTAQAPAAASPGPDAAVTLGTLETGPNPALDDWRTERAA